MFKGSIPALITPFKDNKIDLKALENLVDWHVSQGSHGLVAVGTTGESPTLSHDEHKTVVEAVVKRCSGRIPVIAGAGSNNTEESIDLIKFAKKIGADGALVVTPYYNKPNQRGLIKHYTALHDSCDLPIIIYNIPGRSVIDMTIETMAKLAKLERIVGVKDATGDVSRVSDIRLSCGTNFIQLSGNDEIALGFNAHGGVGCISVIANIAPKLSAEFQNSMLEGNYSNAIKIQDKLIKLHRAAFLEPNPCPIKYALSKLNLAKNEVRSPLVVVDSETEKVMDEALRYAGII